MGMLIKTGREDLSSLWVQSDERCIAGKTCLTSFPVKAMLVTGQLSSASFSVVPQPVVGSSERMMYPGATYRREEIPSDID